MKLPSSFYEMVAHARVIKSHDGGNTYTFDATAEGVCQIADRITELEAPFILTDKVPTEPGWYVYQNMRLDDLPSVVFVRSYGGKLCILNWEIPRYEGCKWGSAPLPLPTESDSNG